MPVKKEWMAFLKRKKVGYEGGGGGGGGGANICFVETTVVPATRSMYFWRGSGPGVAIPIIQSNRRKSQ